MAVGSVVPDVAQKEAALASCLSSLGSCVVAFSGGVDSVYLAVAAIDVLGADRMLAVLGVSPAVPREISNRAGHLATRFRIPFAEIATYELADADYVANRGDRCFYCKRELWGRLLPVAESKGFAHVVDGTIADDLSEHRPGRAAGERAGVLSPLAMCGFTKGDVRAAARARGIPIWDAPASPCLASRLAVGVPVTHDRLAAVERAEAALRALGIVGDLRVRHLGANARVELPADSLPQWSAPSALALIASAVRGAGFDRVLLDPHGYRRGSLNSAAQ